VPLLAREAAELEKRPGHALAALKRDERRALSLLAAGFSYREIGQLTDWTYTN
jgi:DNA-directed RNA polymerase specialized sigma24 family protein